MPPAFVKANSSFWGLHTDRGVSGETRSLRTQVDEARQSYLFDTASGSGWRDLIDEVIDVWNEHLEDDWDARGARAVSNESYYNTMRFVAATPTHFAIPKVAAEPNGNLMLDWFGEGRDSVSIIVGGDGILYYAAVFGPSKVHGQEPYTDELPDAIVAILERIPGAS